MLHHTKSHPLTGQHTLAVKLEYALGTWGGSWHTRRSLLLLVQPLLLMLAGQPVVAGPYPRALAQLLQVSCLLASPLLAPIGGWQGASAVCRCALEEGGSATEEGWSEGALLGRRERY